CGIIAGLSLFACKPAAPVALSETDKAAIRKVVDEALTIAAAEPRDWAAYIGSVAGCNHELEAQGVKENGTKLSEAVAKVLFPCWKGLRYRP
ncbi:hypothetical protein MUO93_06820, partial [Candidatus Bathyarchaeota archaeon]|nr:hypothetical protein [Candidatus Bathyarchaeota archaeon]